MAKYRLELAYDGTHFRGWQKNNALRTVQNTLERALFALLNRALPVEGASRTDSGVHALGQCASFECDRDLSSQVLCRGLNALLPPDVRVRSAAQAPPAFHPSIDALEKTYVYTLSCGPCQLPLQRWSSWHLFRPLSLENMQSVARLLIGERDFSAFANRGDRERQSRWCHVTDIQLRTDRAAAQLSITVKGGHFLYKMVRNLVGTLVWAGLGKLTGDQIPAIFASGLRSRAGVTAPARGLVLHSIRYPPMLFDAAQ